MPSGTSDEGLRATQELQVDDRRRRDRATATGRPWLTARPFRPPARPGAEATVSAVQEFTGPWTPSVTASAAPSICTDVAELALVQYLKIHAEQLSEPPAVVT